MCKGNLQTKLHITIPSCGSDSDSTVRVRLPGVIHTNVVP